MHIRHPFIACIVPFVAFACAAGDTTDDDTTGSASTDKTPAVTGAVSTTNHGWLQAKRRFHHDAGTDAPAPSDSGTSTSNDAGSTASDSGSSASDSGSTTNDAGSTTTNDQCLFPCDNPWYQDVSTLPAYTAYNYTSAIGTWGRSNTMTIDFSIVTLIADAATPRYTFTLDPNYDPDNDHDPVPVPGGGAVEGESAYACTQGGDCHLIVHDLSQNKLFELWQADNSSGSWKATQETAWDLTRHYGPEGRGYGCTSADAAGLSLMPGLIRPGEVASGEIKHAIRFILPGSRIEKNGYTAPATHSTSVYSGAAPMGLRLRLKPTFDESTLPSQGAKVVARAFKKYGMILADAGQDALTAESDRFSSVKWSGLLGALDLSSLKVSDFEAVEVGTVNVPSSMDCVRSY